MKQNKYKFVFVRHSKTGKAEKDLDRQLTEQGLVMAEAMAEKIGAIPFDFCLTSPAMRVKQTIGAVQNRRGENIFPVHEIDELYLPAEDTPNRVALDAVFGRLGYAPLSKYMGEPEFANMVDHNDQVIEKVVEHIEGFDPDDNKDVTILVGGHAIMTNLLLHDLVHMYFLDNEVIAKIQKMAAEVVLGEAECFVLEFNPAEGALISLEHLKPELAPAPATV
jgi:broad specificity phosphatase PhoE